MAPMASQPRAQRVWSVDASGCCRPDAGAGDSPSPRQTGEVPVETTLLVNTRLSRNHHNVGVMHPVNAPTRLALLQCNLRESERQPESRPNY
jgi:hypothetical protein